MTTYPLETTMNYVAREEKVSVFNDITLLAAGISVGSKTISVGRQGK